MDEKSLSHTSWNCKYHIVLVPVSYTHLDVYKRQVLQYKKQAV